MRETLKSTQVHKVHIHMHALQLSAASEQSHTRISDTKPSFLDKKNYALMQRLQGSFVGEKILNKRSRTISKRMNTTTGAANVLL